MKHRELIAFVVLLTFLGLSVPMTASGLAVDAGLPALPGEDGATERYIVGFYTLPDLEVGDSYNGAVVLEVHERTNWILVETDGVSAFHAETRLDDDVRYVEWDNPHYASVMLVPNDARYNDAGHWGSKKIGGEAAWDRTTGSTAVKVAVIDSGLRKTHEEFAASGRVLQGYDFHNGDNDPNDDCGHGTHVAGTIGATINNGLGLAGMAQATIIPVKGLGTSWMGCSGSTSALASSLEYARDQGAHLSSNSWGGGSSSTLDSAINYAYNGGVTQVAAAGNSGPCTNCVSSPWKDGTNPSKVIIVGSTTSSDGQSSFSSEGPELDVSAPGSDILSAWHSNDASYNTISGTSMATPHVTGTAALLFALDGTLTYTDVDSVLKNTAVDLGSSGRDDKFGDGRIDADAATAAVGGGGGTPNDPPTASFSSSCTDLSCSFDGTGSSDSDGTISSYSWNFGDGSTGSGATPSHTYGADGTYTVTLTVTDDDGATDSTSQSVTVSGGGGGTPGTVFAEDFDDGSAAGWTKNTGALWHLNTGCGTAHSGSYKLVWADSTSCTYDVGDTGAQWAKTPAIDLAGYSSASVAFWHWFETESYSGAYDVLQVQYSCNDSTWTTLQQWDSADPNVSSWTEESYDVSSCAGGNLWVRWHADSIDSLGNNYAGWRVDTVSVSAS